jgi:hypothetical protein
MPTTRLQLKTRNSTASGRSSSKSPRSLSPTASARLPRSLSPTAATRTPRAATARAATARAATARAATRTPIATSPRAATVATAATAAVRSPRALSPTAFAAAVAAKDTNLFHNLPEDIQIYIMKLAKGKKKNSRGKYELYKKIYNNREVFIEWLEEIRRDGVDEKKRVRNPLREGGLIYTNKNGLYNTLWHLCVVIFPTAFKWDTIPTPPKRYYRHPSKFYNVPQ